MMNRSIYAGWARRLALLVLLLAASVAHAARLRDICDVQGAQMNILKGVGIVVGLAGTGDKAEAAILAQGRLLQRMGIEISDPDLLSSDNAAIVMVTAELPAFTKQGTRIDVKVDSMHDAKSLEGGTLLETHLRGPGSSETVYAIAQGTVSVGGFNAAGGGGTSIRRNHVAAGRIPMGATVEREVPSTITDGTRIILTLKTPDFITADKVQQAISGAYGAGSAEALTAGTIRITIPQARQGNLVAFIANLMDLSVTTDPPARVIINERTGTIVVGGNVIIRPCQVAHGSLTIKVASTPVIAQPLPFTDAQAIESQIVDLEVEMLEAHLMPVEGTSAGDVAAALNKLKVTPRDMISIFQALRQAGALEADLETM